MLLASVLNTAKEVTAMFVQTQSIGSCSVLDLKHHPLLSQREEFIGFDKLQIFCFTGIYWFKRVGVFFKFIGCCESLGRAAFSP